MKCFGAALRDGFCTTTGMLGHHPDSGDLEAMITPIKKTVARKIEDWWHSIFPATTPPKQTSTLEQQYAIMSPLGEGEFAKVFLARSLKTGELVAIKIIDFSSAKSAQDAIPIISRTQKEIRNHSRLIHRNIVRIHEYIQLQSQIAVVMGYAPGGELFDYIHQRQHLTEDRTRHFMRQLIDAVKYMHEVGIIHRDLKLENILVDERENLMISDFGFSTVDDQNTLLFTACGSPCYAAPEIVLSRAGYVGPPVDIWSCGVIMYTMIFGHLPFENDLKKEMKDRDPKCSQSITWTPANVYQLYHYIKAKPVCFPKNVDVSPAGLDLAGRLLEVDPIKRITIPEILQHSWFAQNNFE